MISYKQRHEVARKLRVLACTPDEIGITEHAVIRDLGISSGIYDDCCKSEEVLAVADLIDRPTCRNVSGCQDTFKCSECRCKVELIAEVCNEYGEPLGVPLMPSWCPNCGAMVTEKEDCDVREL